MTVEIETPTGTITGSSVRQLEYYFTRNLLTQFGGNLDLSGNIRERGEAIVVDMPDGDKLFVLLEVDAVDTVWAGFCEGRKRSSKELKRRLDWAKSSGQLYTFPDRRALQDIYQDYPQTVRFADLSEPLSVKAVDLGNLSATYGDGYALTRITVQMVNEPLTVRIGKPLSWLAQLDGRYLGGGVSARGAPLGLYGGRFRLGK